MKQVSEIGFIIQIKQRFVYPHIQVYACIKEPKNKNRKYIMHFPEISVRSLDFADLESQGDEILLWSICYRPKSKKKVGSSAKERKPHHQQIVILTLLFSDQSHFSPQHTTNHPPSLPPQPTPKKINSTEEKNIIT